MTDLNIKKGCIAKCGIGLLGLVTSERKEMTRYGVEAWIAAIREAGWEVQ